MYYKKILCLFLLFVFSFANSQEGIPVYSDYLSDNYYLIHPSMAGAANCAKVRLTARRQWLGEQDAPELQTLSFNGRVSDRSGAGIILFNDKNGYHSQKGVKLTYAYHILFSRDEIDLNQLSFGVNAGIIQNELDQSTFEIFDPVISGGIIKDSYFNLDFGLSYNYLDSYAHFTVQSALETRRELYSELESDNLRKYLLSLGHIFGNPEKLLWEPSVLFQVYDKTKERKIDFNLKVFKNINIGSIWAAISYRRSLDSSRDSDLTASQNLQYITPILGINAKNFMFAYTYSQIVGNVKFDNSPYHQITLGVNLFCREKRYDCYCPAINP